MTDRLHVCRQTFSVSFDYPVVFTRNLFDPANGVLAGELARDGATAPRQAVVVVDGGVAAAHPGLEARIAAYAAAHPGRPQLAAPPRVVPGGEAAKSDMDLVREMIHLITRSGLCRHSYVIAIGGGAVLDAVGFAAALVHRGLRLVRVPTTVLAQNDAGVGVKNGVNTDGGKNTVGTFAPPYAVLNDSSFLPTLSAADWIAGAAEAFKVAIIKDADFFDFLCEAAPRLRARDLPAMERLIVRCAELHLEHIRTSGDPFETGTARPLDFGHWAAHRLEVMSGWRIGHGHAVAAGIALDSLYARRAGWLAAPACDRILAGLAACGFPLWYDELARRLPDGSLDVLGGLRSFREHLGGELSVTFPHGLGDRIEVHEVDAALVEACVDELARRGGAAWS